MKLQYTLNICNENRIIIIKPMSLHNTELQFYQQNALMI